MMERRNRMPALPVLLLLGLLCGLCVVSATPTAASICPDDCRCTLSQHTHKPLMHAKCNSTKGLQQLQEPLKAVIPIHSIDLSFLGLTRVDHVLDMLPDLTSVDLSHNELHDLGHLGKRIKKLNLKHNRLTSSKLVKLPQHLQVLNLQHNDITNLPMELKHLRNLQQLELGHNIINCSCATLEVRNWLQEQNVYMEKPVICSTPTEAHGLPWLQLKQAEICEKEQHGWYGMDSGENDLMLGDQPRPEELDEEVDELGKDFLVIKNKKRETVKEQQSEVEGSGDWSEPNMELRAPPVVEAAETPEEPKAEALAAEEKPQQDDSLVESEDEEGSGAGSGGGILLIPPIKADEPNQDDFEPPTLEEEDRNDISDNDNSYDSKPVEKPVEEEIIEPSVFHPIGIFETNESQQPAASEAPVVPVVETRLDTAASPDVVTDAPVDGQKSEDILAAKVGKDDDTKAIYYLLGVIALIVLGLILFVAIKRCKYNSNAAARDAEAARQTELLDMDKKNLGKPLARNGHEHSPLIGEKTKLDDAQIVNGAGKKPYDSKDGAGQQPLLNGNGTANGDAKEVPTIQEPLAGEPAPHEYYPITPRYPTPQSPRASKYAQHPQGGDGAEQNNNNEPDGAYLPSSPKSGRYSPVYSPETGRVKIKLTETPKPKTPMLVTRSKSNAGDIITTPVGPSLGVPTHQPTAVAAGANGYAQH